MTLSLSRPFAVVDLETTGKDPVTDRVVEFGLVTLHPDGTRTRCRTLVNPGIPIPPEATAVHHIHDVDVVGEPTFTALAPRLYEMLSGVDIGGYRERAFDLVMLGEEFRRAGYPDPPWQGAAIVDAFEVYQHIEPRTLVAAHRRFVGHDFAGAHSAAADAEAALDTLLGMLAHAPGLPREPAALEAATIPEYAKNVVDPTGKLRRGDDGEIVLAFSKYSGTPLKQADSGFLRWMLARDDFHPAVTAAVRAELSRRAGAMAGAGPGFPPACLSGAR